MLELKIHFPQENTGHVLEFHKDRQDWGYAFDSDQNWQEICLTLDAFVENAPESGLILRIAAGSFEANSCGESLCYSELYMVLKNGINHFVFNTAEMNIEKPMHMERIRQVYFGGWGESGAVHFSIAAPGLESTACIWNHMQNGRLTGYLDESNLNMSVFRTLQSFNRDILRSIHRTRDKELFITFKKCEKEIFCNGLELGAGDCYQSHRIAAYTKKYLCTDINPLGFPENEGKVTYDVLDAEKVAEKFPPGTFDFVYSSSLLEHLPEPEKTVNGIYQVLQEGGIFVCLLPNPFWRILNTLFYPYSEHLYYLQERHLKKIFICWKKEDDYNNNIKGENQERKKERKKETFWPDPHGISSTRREELVAFSAHRWKKIFRKAGFKIVRTKRGPVSSGLGLGHERIKSWMEFLGFSTVNIFVLSKGNSERAKRYF